MKIVVLIALLYCVHRCYGNNLPQLFEGQLSRNQSLIVGGVNVTVFQHPSIAYLFMTFSNDTGDCSGTILSDKFVLTAGHCLVGKLIKIEITVGSTAIAKNKGRHYTSAAHFVHPRFKMPSDYDVGVVKTRTGIKLDAVAQPARLVSSSHLVVNEELTVVGWGSVSEFSTDTRPVLKAVKISVVAMDMCENIYKGKTVVLSARTFCAGYMPGDRGICHGDSGGPAINKDGYQVGLASGAVGCARAGFPAVFVDIASLRGWIEEKMKL